MTILSMTAVAQGPTALPGRQTGGPGTGLIPFQALFEQAGVGVCQLGPDGTFLRANEKYCAVAGYGPAELLGLELQDLVHPDDREAARSAFARVLAQEAPACAELRLVRKDWAAAWVNLSLTLVRRGDGEPGYVLALVEDIQWRKEMEAALKEERKARQRILERQVAERTSELVNANRRLEALLYAASHDLKAPLSRISNFSALLGKGYRDRLEGDGQVMLDFIQANAMRLTFLVDDLLAHARIDQQIVVPQPVDLGASVQAAIGEKVVGLREKGLAIRVDLPPVQVLADPYGLNQALQNLLENAIKYSANTSEPVIDIGGGEVDGRFRLWVRDNGIGFDMEYHDEIFEIFRRLHSYAEYAGTGVGLALVKRAMECMGGRVWAESEPGKGATFYLEFEIAQG